MKTLAYSKAKAALARSLARRLWKDRRGQVVVEFMLSMMITLLVVLVILEIASLGTDMFMVRYASYVGARGYLAHADYERGVREVVGSLVINKTGRIEVEEIEGKGVRVRVEIKEFFPIHTLFKDTDRTWLERETFLGREPDFRGDNAPEYDGGGIWDQF